MRRSLAGCGNDDGSAKIGSDGEVVLTPDAVDKEVAKRAGEEAGAGGRVVCHVPGL